MDLSTTYLGLTLKNPIVVGSCGLTKTVEQIKACEQAGAGALVMKSLFEEQIREAEAELEHNLSMHPEVMGYLQADLDMRYGSEQYTETIVKAKNEVDIPVIASVNCYTSKWWVDYAKKIEHAGADALELNVYVMPSDFSKSAKDIEDVYVEIVKTVKAHLKIPVALKLSPHFTAFGNFAMRLEKYGVDGLVLFNRFVQPDINLADISTTVKPSFNDPVGFGQSLRWIALLSAHLELDLAASGGARGETEVIKQLLAGASVVQLVSVLYAKGLDKIQQILTGLEGWMEKKHFSAVTDFQGKLNQSHSPQSESYIRAQYIKSFTGVE
ncbi:MAG: dihydroorotate dehydrogenase-like protein [bacterium]|nr:dihydroorotate dehydrogenase-like protein [bacterium]